MLGFYYCRSSMEQRISLMTLGVDDLELSPNFYDKGLGWKISGDAGESIWKLDDKGNVQFSG